MVNYVYLLQENIRGEKIYKIGKSNDNKHPNEILLFQMICNCEDIENKIMKTFKCEFKQRKDIGNEYFEGDYYSMIHLIYCIIKIEDSNSKSSDIEGKLDSICNIFPDHRNDESFGGKKKYIKLSKESDKYVIHYIGNTKEIETNSYAVDELQYFNALIENKFICIGGVYDINSESFVNKINQTKYNIKIENYEEFKQLIPKQCNTEEERIKRLFYHNMIIDGELFVSLVNEGEGDHYAKFKKLGDFDKFNLDIGINKCETFYKINSKYYHFDTYLRKYRPYLIEWNEEKNYRIFNRDGECIGVETKDVKRYKTGDCLEYNDITKDNIIELSNKFKKIVKNNRLKTCLNMHKFTENILSVFGLMDTIIRQTNLVNETTSQEFFIKSLKEKYKIEVDWDNKPIKTLENKEDMKDYNAIKSGALLYSEYRTFCIANNFSNHIMPLSKFGYDMKRIFATRKKACMEYNVSREIDVKERFSIDQE